MPLHLRIFWVITLATFIVSAALAPSYETGVRIYTTPALHLGVVGCLIAFALRREWSWHLLRWGSLAAVIINVAFFPSEQWYGRVTDSARVLAAVQAAACLGVFISMQSNAAKQWFHGARTPETHSGRSEG